ncbi:MAG: hypothetical protein HYU87_05440 [Chloroflexi bacterium]|nr:hypothetical protein [Chloroflexota bacterium]
MKVSTEDSQLWWATEVTAPVVGGSMPPVRAGEVLVFDDVQAIRKFDLQIPPATGGRPITISWPPVPGAGVYCVLFVDWSKGVSLKRAGVCGRTDKSNDLGQWIEVRSPSWTTPALVSGRRYVAIVQAFARTDPSPSNWTLGQSEHPLTLLGFSLGLDKAVRGEFSVP